jgi:choline-sulfatase
VAGLYLALRLGAGLAVALWDWLRGWAAETARAQRIAVSALTAAVGLGLARHLLDVLPAGETLVAWPAGLAVALCVGWLSGRLFARFALLAQPRTWLAVALLSTLAAVPVGVRFGGAPATTTRAQGPSFLLVSIDTLRVDHVGAYGARTARTPMLDGLARRGYRFNRAMSHSIVTGPSHLTLLTGLRPETHGVIENSLRAPAGTTTLGKVLGAAGYRTGAFVSGAPVTDEALGILDQFQHHDDDFRPLRAIPRSVASTGLGKLGYDAHPYSRDAAAVTRPARDWLAADTGRPFFAWVHYYDPHLPYEAPERLVPADAKSYRGPGTGDWYRSKHTQREAIIHDPAALAHMDRLYDAEIAHADEQLGKLIEAAQRSAGPAGLWILVTPDHGESFGEHGNYFWRDLYEPTLHVPMLLVPPRPLAAGRVIEPLVGLVDVAPTVLDLLAQKPLPRRDGASMAPLLQGAADDRVRTAIIVPSRPDPYHRTQRAVRRADLKAIRNEEGWATNVSTEWQPASEEVYDLASDPAEALNLAAQHPEVLRQLLGATVVPLPTADRPNLTDSQLKMLKSLGYGQ